MNIKKIIVRILCYLIGMMFLAAGVVIAINANLGISPVASLSRALYLVLRYYGITTFTLGNCVAFLYCIYVALQFLILGKELPITNLLQLVVSFMFGWFVDLFEFLIGDFRIPTYAGSFIMLMISLLLLVVGVSLYLGAKIMPMPSEGIGLSVSKKLKKIPFYKVKWTLDCTFVLVSTITMLVTIGNIGIIDETGTFSYLIREGTVITAFTVGPAMGFFTKKVLNPLLFNKLYGEEK